MGLLCGSTANISRLIPHGLNRPALLACCTASIDIHTTYDVQNMILLCTVFIHFLALRSLLYRYALLPLRPTYHCCGAVP
jgi:hypothetical protein